MLVEMWVVVVVVVGEEKRDKKAIVLDAIYSRCRWLGQLGPSGDSMGPGAGGRVSPTWLATLGR